MNEIDKAIVFIGDMKRVVDHANTEKTSCLVNIPLERAFNFTTILAALREQQMRELGCECCKDRYAKDIGRTPHTNWCSFEPIFCPMCGRRLGVERDKN